MSTTRSAEQLARIAYKLPPGELHELNPEKISPLVSAVNVLIGEWNELENDPDGQIGDGDRMAPLGITARPDRPGQAARVYFTSSEMLTFVLEVPGYQAFTEGSGSIRSLIDASRVQRAWAILDPAGVPDGLLQAAGHRPDLTDDQKNKLQCLDDMIANKDGAWCEVFDNYRAENAPKFVRIMQRWGLPIGLAFVALRYANSRGHFQPKSSTDALVDLVFDVYEPGEAAQPAGPVPIDYAPQHLVSIVDQTESALLADVANGPVLNFGGYATVQRRPEVDADGDPTGRYSTKVVRLDNVHSMRERILRCVEFYGTKNDMPVHIGCPDLVVNTLLSRNGGQAPVLNGLLTAPTILADGRMIDSPGFDAETGLFAAFERGDFPAMGRRLDLDAAKRSFDWLTMELFAEFPFATPTDQAVAVAALLTGLERRVCGLAPAFLLESAVQGSGKTALAQLIGYAVGNDLPAPMTWGDSEEELTKIIFSALLEGRQVLLFDNLKAGTAIDSPAFAKLVTASTFKGRVLGVSQMRELPTSALLLLTGNNILPEGDTPSRVMTCRLDPHMERPDRRTFSRPDIFAWAALRRPSIVRHALTIIKAYIDSGRPSTGAAATRFPQWDVLVRDPVAWVSGIDVAASSDAAFQVDSTITMLRDLHAAWAECFDDAAVPVGRIMETISPGIGAFSPAALRLEQAVRTLCGAVRRGESVDGRRIGRRLQAIKGRPIDGRELIGTTDTHSKQQLWSLAAANVEQKREVADVFS